MDHLDWSDESSFNVNLNLGKAAAMNSSRLQVSAPGGYFE